MDPKWTALHSAYPVLTPSTNNYLREGGCRPTHQTMSFEEPEFCSLSELDHHRWGSKLSFTCLACGCTHAKRGPILSKFCPEQTARILEADEVDRSGVSVDPTRPASVHFWTGATSDHFSLLQSTSVTYLAQCASARAGTRCAASSAPSRPAKRAGSLLVELVSPTWSNQVV